MIFNRWAACQSARQDHIPPPVEPIFQRHARYESPSERFKAEADLVTLTLQFSGTHSKPPGLVAYGSAFGPPASGKAVTLPPQKLEYTVVEGKIKRMRSLSAGHAPGLADVFKVFGV